MQWPPDGLGPGTIDSPRVLLVDDDRAWRRRFGLQFSALFPGFSFLTAPMNEEATDALDQHEPHIVVADLDMPKLGGFVLLRHALEHHPKTRRIVCAPRGINPGPLADHVLYKPFGVRDLGRLLVCAAQKLA